MEVYEMTALEIAEKIRLREISPMDAVMSVAKAYERFEGEYNCFASFNVEFALAQAAEVEKKLKNGDKLSLLAGVPFAVKDNICEAGKVTSCASKMLENFVSPYDATVIGKLKSAGLIPLGKTNMDEFAMGWSTENSIYGSTKNPHNASRVAGGSSGGSAAAVASGEAVIALGSDTGGSVRQPASFCGVTGLKPTYGAVSRYGLIAFASSLDAVGVIGRNCADTSAFFNLISGRDKRDLTSYDSTPFSLNIPESLDGYKIGVPKEFFEGGVDTDVKNRVIESIKTFEELGAKAEEFSLDIIKYAVPAYCIIACAEASSNLARYDGVKYGHRADGAKTLEELYVMSRSEGFSAEVKQRIMLGNFVLSAGYFDAYYTKALKVKRLICEAFEKALSEYDFIVTPVSPCTAFEQGGGGRDKIQMYLSDAFTSVVNLAGLPALSVPCGTDSEGMPVGVQLIGRAADEKTLLTAGHLFEQRRGV